MKTATLALLVVICLVGCAHNPGPVTASKPNIIVLFADDLGYGDLGSYGHPYIRTPHLDRLAAEGQRWTDFYVAAPVCSPSRGALLTGRLPNRTGLYGRRIAVMFPNDPGGIPEDELTLAEALRSEGYATAVIGKWHLGDSPDNYPTRHGFDYWYGVPYSNDMDWVDEPGFEEMMAMRAQGKGAEVQKSISGRAEKYMNPKVEYWNVPILRSQREGDKYKDEMVERPALQTELTQRYTAEALQFIDQNQDQPFLIYLPYSMPHTPIFRSEDFADKSLAGRYGDVIEELDWSVGAIVKKLKDLSIDDQTLVVFTSDNGPWLLMNQHGGTAGLLRNGKATTFEGGMRVPAVFWWPGHIEPSVVSDIGSTMDIYATALSLAGAASNGPSDGFDLSGTLLDSRKGPRDSVAYYRSGELRAYRKGPYKLHLITEGAYGLPPERKVHAQPILNFLPDDPSEKYDVSAQHPAVVQDILDEIERHRSGLTEAAPIFDQRLRSL